MFVRSVLGDKIEMLFLVRSAVERFAGFIGVAETLIDMDGVANIFP